jgi:succinoglycan biosynthesis protein ExoA
LAAPANDIRSASHFDGVEHISVIVPMLNAAAHVERLAGELAAQDFDGEVELFVADGGSSDSSRELFERAAAERGLQLTMLAHPGGSVSEGLNLCLARAGGDLIVRWDCHSSYPTNYLRLCARAAEATGAWNVGGRLVACGESPTERAVASAMSSPFGGIGWTRHDAGRGRIDVDTVTFGAFRPIAFDRVGGFDESLVRGQDDELNLRMRLAGGRVVLDPAVEVRYRPRDSLRAVFGQYFGYGRWKVPVMLKHRRISSARSLAPLLLVTALGGSILGAAFSETGVAVLGLEVVAYVAISTVFAFRALRARGESLRLLPRTMAAFPAFHLGYGLGLLWGGLLAVSAPRRRGRLQPTDAV